MHYPEYILLCILFYLIGSVPTAYLVLKFSHGKNIIKEGSGNVGALNSYEVTNSKLTGGIVLTVDFLKGFIPAFIFLSVAGYSLETMLIPISLIIVGHNFSVWIKFKGGRGLATAAGISAAVEPWALLIWCVLYMISYGIKRNIHIGNIAATLLLPIAYYFLNPLINKADSDTNIMITLIIVLSLIILLKHISPIIEIIKSSKSQKKQMN